MTTAEELRKYADKALKEGGIMYFSDEYLDALANRAEAEQAENEKLRAEAVRWELEHCPACKNVADLQEALDENAKLRELVKNMHGWLVVNYEKHYVIPLNGLNDIERDMRELGIEVE